MRSYLVLAALLWLSGDAGAASDSGEDPASGRIYSTREERRQAGLDHELTDWLTVGALGELEYQDERFTTRSAPSKTGSGDFSRTLELALELKPLRFAKAEVIYEYQADRGSERHSIDEALVSFDTRDLELQLGRIILPFGMYYSHFASGPLLEFGETRGSGAVLSWGPHDRQDLAGFIYHGGAQKLGTRDIWSKLDWGLAAQVSPFDFLTLGASYLSDLADAKAHLLGENGNRYASRVGAFGAYAVVGLEHVEITVEFLGALGSFRELDADRNRPAAWNIELAYLPIARLEVALRYEGSRALKDAPQCRAGVSVSWRVTHRASLTFEYLQGRFARGFGEDSAGRELRRVEHLGAQFSLAL